MKDIDYLQGVEEKRLAEIWCELNRWDWPSEIPEPEVKQNENPRRLAIMDFISDVIGHKRCNREWNIKSMTDEEHEVWYGKTFAS